MSSKTSALDEMIARYGVEGYEAYKVAESLRLAKLHEEKKDE